MIYSDFAIEQLKNTLCEKFLSNSTPKKYAGIMLEALEVIKQLQQKTSKDVVSVVRCKECKYRSEAGNCEHPRHTVLPTAYPMDYCSYGEVR